MTDVRRAERAAGIRVARARANLEQADVAELAGLNQSTVSRAEQGRGSDDTFDAIEAAFARLALQQATAGERAS